VEEKTMKKKSKITNIYPIGTQKYVILEHLKIRGISQVEAQEVYKIRRLAARISEMKNDYPIKSVLKKDLTNQRYAKYYL
jgi:hypothetical protein